MKKPGLGLTVLTGVAFIVLLLVIRVATQADQCSALDPPGWDSSEWETIEIEFSTVDELKRILATHPQLLKQFNQPAATDVETTSTTQRPTTDSKATITAKIPLTLTASTNAHRTAVSDITATTAPGTPREDVETTSTKTGRPTTGPKTTELTQNPLTASTNAGPKIAATTAPGMLEKDVEATSARTQHQTTGPKTTEITNNSPTLKASTNAGPTTVPDITTTTAPGTSRKDNQKPKTTDAPCSASDARVLGKQNKTCNIEYFGKCFFFAPVSWDLDIFNYTTAKKECKNENAKLGNIYDECHYNKTKDFLEKAGRRTGKFWTGMTVTPQGVVRLSDGTESTWIAEEHWLSIREQNKTWTKMSISKRSLTSPKRVGMDRKQYDTNLNGYFCERNKTES